MGLVIANIANIIGVADCVGALRMTVLERATCHIVAA